MELHLTIDTATEDEIEKYNLEKVDEKYIYKKQCSIEAIKYNETLYGLYIDFDKNLELPVPIMGNGNDGEVIISCEALDNIIRWSEHHSVENTIYFSDKKDGVYNDTGSVYNDNGSKFMDLKFKEWSEFDKEFCNQISNEDNLAIALASNWLSNKALLYLVCSKLADVTRDLSEEKIRTLFNQPDDLTDEEKEEIRKQNEWLNSDYVVS